MKVNRRTVLGAGATAVAGAAIYGTADVLARDAKADAATPGEALNLAGGVEGVSGGTDTPAVTKLTPFQDPLRIPPTLTPSRNGITEIRQIAQHIRLHSQMPK